MKGLKVISATEMARIEKLAISAGVDEYEFMLNAAKGIFQEIKNQCVSQDIAIFIGKGNNAADALLAGIFLLEKGYKVRVFQLFDVSSFSTLCLKNYKIFKEKAGEVIPLFSFSKSSLQDLSLQDLSLQEDEVIVDGIFGTGFKGKIEEPISKIIESINKLKNFTISIDIPSGVNGDNGQVLTTAIIADKTICLELPKSGYFFNQGWEHVGDISRVSFGLEKKYVDMAQPDFYLLDEKKALALLPEVKRSRHKYEAGYVVGISGSLEMEGAANLSGKAALRSGAGIVKIFLSQHEKTKENTADELIKMRIDFNKKDELLNICNSAKSIFIGPGIGRSKEVENLLFFLLPKIKPPVLMDADALYFFSKNLTCTLPEKVVMTPHRKEMLRLLHEEKLSDQKLIVRSQDFCERYNICLVLKGPFTLVFSPKEKPLIIMGAGPAMATAGTGDVLSGIIASLLSQGLNSYEAAVLGVYLHIEAGKIAAKEKTPYGMIASDLIEHLPEVFKRKNNFY